MCYVKSADEITKNWRRRLEMDLKMAGVKQFLSKYDDGKLSFSRYRGLIIITVVFVILISIFLALNFYSSGKIERNMQEIHASSSTRDLIQSITRDVFTLKLAYGEDPESPHIKSTADRIRRNSTLFDENLKAFADGGSVTDSTDGVVRKVAAVKGENAKHIYKARNEWLNFNSTLKDYLASIDDIHSNKKLLDIVANEAQSSSAVIHEELGALTDEIAKKASRQASLLKVIQVFGVLIAISYFLLFVLVFVRRLYSADKKADYIIQENQQIMATVKEGLFLVDKDLKIGNQYSAELEKMLGKYDLAGKNLEDVLEGLIPSEDLGTTVSFFGQLFKKKVKAKLINDLNPLHKIKVEVDDLKGFKTSRYLDFKFSRVFSGSEITHVLASVSDITAQVNLEKRLELEREQNELQIEMLQTLFNTDAELIKGFLYSIRGSVDKINSILRSPGANEFDLQTKLRNIYHEVHSIKGESSALRLHGFVTVATSFEEKIKSLQDESRLNGNDFLPLTVMLDEMVGLFNAIEQLANRIGIFSGGAYSRDEDNNTVAAPQLNDEVVVVEKQERFVDNKAKQHFWENFAEDIAKRNNKKVTVKCKGVDTVKLPEDIENKLKEVTTQLLRNAIYHGIETPEVRVENGKPETGVVQIILDKITANNVQLTVEDDGAGINIDLIRKKAVEKALCTEGEAEIMSRSELYKLIFKSGFSTVDEDVEDAGRGVGMNVVKDRINELGGKLKINSLQGQYTRFSINIPIDE